MEKKIFDDFVNNFITNKIVGVYDGSLIIEEDIIKASKETTGDIYVKRIKPKHSQSITVYLNEDITGNVERIDLSVGESTYCQRVYVEFYGGSIMTFMEVE